MAVSKYLITALILYLSYYWRIESLSSCHPVDSIFLFKSSLIINDQYDTDIELFVEKLVFKASSERSGIGMIIWDLLPNDDSFDNIILNIRDTSYDYSTKHTVKTIHNECIKGLNSFYDDNLMENTDNTITLQQAIDQADKMFVEQTNAEDQVPEAIFIFDDGYEGREICRTLALDPQFTEKDYETLYFVHVDSEFELESVYDCQNDKEIAEYDGLEDLYKITCPTGINLGRAGNGNMNKMAQYLEPCVILSCDIKISYDEDTESTSVLRTSTIIVEDNIDDEMSFEIGYILIAWGPVFATLPNECDIPVMQIVDIEEIRDTANDKDNDGKRERLLKLNIIEPPLWKYMDDVKAHSNRKPYFKRKHNDSYQCVKSEINDKRRRLGCSAAPWDWGDCAEDAVDAVGDVAEDVVDAIGDLVASGFQEVMEYIIDELLSVQGWSDIGFHEQGSIEAQETIESKYTKGDLEVTGRGVLDVAISWEAWFNFQIAFNADISYIFPFDFRINDLSFKVYGGLGFDFSFKWDFYGEIEISYPILEKYLTTKPMLTFIGIIPVVVHPKVKLEVGASLTSIAKLHFEYSFYNSVYYEFGVSYSSNDGFKLINRFDKNSQQSCTLDGDNLFDASALFECPNGMELAITIDAYFGAELYGAIYVYLKASPSLESPVIIPHKCSSQSRTCTVLGYPTGLQFHPQLKLTVSVGAEPDGFIGDFFDHTGMEGEIAIPGLDGLTIADWGEKEICSEYGVIPTLLFYPCCPANEREPNQLSICVHPNEDWGTQSSATIRARMWSKHDTQCLVSPWKILYDEGKFDQYGECATFGAEYFTTLGKWEHLDLGICSGDGLAIDSITWWDSSTDRYNSIDSFYSSPDSVCEQGNRFWLDGYYEYGWGGSADCSRISVDLSTGQVYVNPSWINFDTNWLLNTCTAYDISDSDPTFVWSMTIIGLLLVNLFCCLYYLYSKCNYFDSKNKYIQVKVYSDTETDYQ